MRTRGIIGVLLALALLMGGTPLAQTAEPPESPDEAVGQVPPRLSFTDGNVSFFRPGAPDWVQAQINTPLAPGDQLYAGSPGSLELQVGSRAFVRAWANAQLGLESQEPDFLQFRLVGGRAAFDLRTLEPGRTVEVDTPNAAITIENPGYYRVDVSGDRTALTARRSGRATVTPAGGAAVAVSSSEEVIIEGTTSPRISSYAAPPRDDWDKWNYARTDALLDAVSARYVSPGVYGVDDLDHHGTWRVVDPYGPVWVPTGLPTGWVPYSTGSWVLDPFYGWTWVDTAPWGWAPYHHGRWVFVNGFWGWAPGPVLPRPVYAPALVAFLGGPGVRVGVGIGGPIVSWVALGWGEPCVPWWGRPGFVHRPWWGGWGGPRVVNSVVIQRTTVVHVEQITVYHNAQLRNGVVVVSEDKFGRGRVAPARLSLEEARSLRPTHAAPRIATAPDHFVPTERRGIRPPEENLRRPVVATRPSQRFRESEAGGGRTPAAAGIPEPAPRLVTPPAGRESGSTLARPPFGQSTVERPMSDRRVMPPPAASRQATSQSPAVREMAPAGRPETLPAPTDRTQPKATPRPESPGKPERQPEAPAPATRQLPAQPRPEPKAVAPAPAAPAAPAGRPEVARPPADPGQQPNVQRREVPARPERKPEAPAPITRQAPAQPRPEPRAAAPAPAPSQPPAQRAVAPPAPARRPEAARPPAKPLPGEPANRLSPTQAEPRSAREGDRQEAAPRGRSQGGSETESRGRSGK